MIRHVLIKLRIATKEDFADRFGQKIIGVPYLEQNSLGVIDKTIKYFSEETDLTSFKTLYANSQIYVFANPNTVEAVSEE